MPTDNKLEPISSQPKATAPMKGGDKNALKLQVDLDGSREWSFGLSDWLPRRRLCLSATFCPCVIYGQNRQRLRHLQRQNVPLPGGGNRFSPDCGGYFSLLVHCLYWVPQAEARVEIRRRYNIRGERKEDCLNSVFCPPCALTQERRELELEEESFS